jgi:hypothetical protein
MIDRVIALIPLPFSVWVWPAAALTVALAWLSAWLWRRIVVATQPQLEAYWQGRIRSLHPPLTLLLFLLTLVAAVLVGELVAIQFLTAWPQNVTLGTSLATVLAVGNVLVAGWDFVHAGLDQASPREQNAGPR